MMNSQNTKSPHISLTNRKEQQYLNHDEHSLKVLNKVLDFQEIELGDMSNHTMADTTTSDNDSIESNHDKDRRKRSDSNMRENDNLGNQFNSADNHNAGVWSHKHQQQGNLNANNNNSHLAKWKIRILTLVVILLLTFFRFFSNSLSTYFFSKESSNKRKYADQVENSSSDMKSSDIKVYKLRPVGKISHSRTKSTNFSIGMVENKEKSCDKLDRTTVVLQGNETSVSPVFQTE
jgi:hypothetical protein